MIQGEQHTRSRVLVIAANDERQAQPRPSETRTGHSYATVTRITCSMPAHAPSWETLSVHGDQTPGNGALPVINLTIEQIRAAQDKDLDAITAVIRETDERVRQIAHRVSGVGGDDYSARAEDFAQDGRVAVWQAIETFKGNTVAEFFAYIDSTVRGALAHSRRRETRQGVSEGVAADFETAIRACDGDPYAAMEYAASAAVGKRRMSPEMAYAARLSYMHLEYLDLGWDTGDSIAATLADADGEGEADESDREAARRALTRVRVRSTLDDMGEQQAHVLRATYGISPVPHYGSENDAELAEDMGIDRKRVRVVRCKAKQRFEELYVGRAS